MRDPRTNPEPAAQVGNPVVKQIGWDKNPELLAAWAEGRTGYPWIDAAMTQLRTQGWLHHLARHAVACFLTRGDLYQHWEEGVAVFDRLLLDADWSLNNGNWQWLSASAFFAQYFRVYSPVAFPKKTDKSGAYVRHFLPGGPGPSGQRISSFVARAGASRARASDDAIPVPRPRAWRRSACEVPGQVHLRTLDGPAVRAEGGRARQPAAYHLAAPRASSRPLPAAGSAADSRAPRGSPNPPQVHHREGLPGADRGPRCRVQGQHRADSRGVQVSPVSRRQVFAAEELSALIALGEPARRAHKAAHGGGAGDEDEEDGDEGDAGGGKGKSGGGACAAPASHSSCRDAVPLAVARILQKSCGRLPLPPSRMRSSSTQHPSADASPLLLFFANRRSRQKEVGRNSRRRRGGNNGGRKEDEEGRRRGWQRMSLRMDRMDSVVGVRAQQAPPAAVRKSAAATVRQRARRRQ